MAGLQQTLKPLKQSARYYWQQSRRPFASLLFILPILALYEGGLLLLGSQAVRNGADVWLRTTLDCIGLESYFLLPILTIACLVGWHYTTRDSWTISPNVLYWMALESAALGGLLLATAHLQRKAVALAEHSSELLVAVGLSDVLQWTGRMVGFCGAGIYEEVLFRLLLIPVFVAFFGGCGFSTGQSALAAIISTSLIFSLAHYVGPHGESFLWFSFSFRCLAGAFFAVLFVYRGFGIAAGTHALYDVFVATLS